MKNLKKLSKEEIIKIIDNIFSKHPTPKEIKKVKRLAMSKNIKLGVKRKLFCKKCYTFFTSKYSEVRIKNKMKTIKCKYCGNISRWKLK